MKHLILSFLFVTSLYIFTGCGGEEAAKKITGYETKTVFIKDNDPSSNINDYSTQGWEIKSQRRAWTALYEGADKEWGTEYSVQKALYE